MLHPFYLMLFGECWDMLQLGWICQLFISQHCGVVRQSGSFIFRFGWRGVGSAAVDLRERKGSRLKGLMRTRTRQLGEFHSMIAGVHVTWAQWSKQCSKGNLEILANILKGWIQAGQTWPQVYNILIVSSWWAKGPTYMTDSTWRSNKHSRPEAFISHHKGQKFHCRSW